ncbi:hypothetical protein [Phytohabitans kaempferiae]|uniref:Uncharacterized protein n=1 Tax=Phytohabitans kaempferiae TaxID=1620943 RepID=A0ABV6MF07_9ACTN
MSVTADRLSGVDPGGLRLTRDARGEVTALTGEGVAHHRRDGDPGWTTVDDPAGATSLRQDEDRTELLRDGHLLARRRRGAAEEWIVPGTPEPVLLVRDPSGELSEVRVGGRAVARRADGPGTRVLRWATGDAGRGELGDGANGLFAVAGASARSVAKRSPAVTNEDVAGTRREWPVTEAADASALGRDRYAFDERGRVVGHEHPELGPTRYRFAGDLLAEVDTPEGPVALHHGTDGRVRSRRDHAGRTTYGYDEWGRRIREAGPAGTRHLAWDDLDRLVRVQTPGATVGYAYDGFGRRVARTVERPGRPGETTVEHRDLQGRLWAVTDPHGRPLRTWLWDRHRCLAAFDGPAGDRPAALYVTAPSGIPVGFVDAGGRVHELPATPYGEQRPAGHPALWFHFADELTGYVHVVQRDADPATWQFLSPDPYRGDDADRRRLLLGLSGPLSTERDRRTNPYAICGFDPVRRVDPNGAVSAGTVLWQIFGGLTWHLPAHIINWLWIHPFVNFSFATILAWLPAAGFDPRGAFDSWKEFWNPGNYSGEESSRQDVASMLMAGWMSSNRTFTFQNAIWGRRKTWDPLDGTASFEPGTPFQQQRFGSLMRITRGDSRNADVVDSWTMVADGIDTQAAATRQFSIAGGTAHAPVLGNSRERLMTEGNLHMLRQILSVGVDVPTTDPAAPARAPIGMHSQATALQECAPGVACAQVTVRTAGRIFTYGGTDPLTVDGDVIRLGGVLAMVTAVQPRAGTNPTTELSVQAGNAGLTLPNPGRYRAEWATLDPAGPQALNAHPAGPDLLQLVDTVVGWTPTSIARINGVAVTPVDRVESHLPVRAQAPLPLGGAVLPLGAGVPVPATLEPDERLRVADGAVAQGAVLRLTRGGDSRLARVVTVTDDVPNNQDLLTLDATPAALGLPGAGDPAVEVLAVQPPRGPLATAVPAGPGSAVTLLSVNSALGANVTGIDVSGALATVTGAETRAIHLAPNNPVPGPGPWNVERFTFPAGARTHDGDLSGPLETVAFDAGDAATTIPPDALLRLRAVAIPAPVPAVAGLVRVADREFVRPAGDATLRAGGLVAVAGAATAVVSVADLALGVTLDRVVGAPGTPVERVCGLAAGERTYAAVRVDGGGIRLTGAVAGGGPALLPGWVAGDIVRITVAGNPAQEWVLSADLDGGRLPLRDGPPAAGGGPAALPGAVGDAATVQRLAPTWPPLAVRQTDAARTSEVLPLAAGGTSRHRWVTAVGAVAVGTAVGIDIGGTVRVAQVVTVDEMSVRTSPLPAGPLTGYAFLARAANTDRISARWQPLGDEIRINDQLAATPAGAVTVLDALGPVSETAVTPKPQALMLPADPENAQWIFTAREALREHELRHTIQASHWGPLFLGLPLGVAGDALWDVRGGSGAFTVSPYETVVAVPEETSGSRPRPAGFRLTAPTGNFRLAPGEVVEFDASGRAWRTVITAIDGEAAGGALFWVQNLPPEGLGDGGLRARTVHHETTEADGWLKVFRLLDLLSNAHIMEFTTGLIWEGLIGLFWRVGRTLLFRPDKAEVTVTDDPARVTLRAADPAALEKLRLGVGADVIVDSDEARDDSYRTVVTAMSGADVTVRDAVPRYPAGAKVRIYRGQGTDPDTFWDIRKYRPASLVEGTPNVISMAGTAPPAFGVMDLLEVKWVGAGGQAHSTRTRVTAVVGGTPPRYQLQDPIALDGADPDTLRVSRLGNDDDPATFWFDTNFYETPFRFRRVTQYLFDPWRALTLNTDFVRPADGSTFKTVLAWITRGLRYAFSNRTWTPLFGYVWWTSVFSQDHLSGLEQSASWNGGELYTTITRSGDPRFAASEGGHGDSPGSYGIFEGELLRMWTWDQWSWNDVFGSQETAAGTVAAGTRVPAQNPALISALALVTPWDDRWRFTPPAGLVAGLEYPAELAQQVAGGAFRPSPLLQIPTRRDVSRNSGVYFAATQAGAWQVGVPNPFVNDQQAQADGEQYHTRTVQVGALTVRASGVDLPWQAPGAAAALTLFVTQAQTIDVSGGNGGTYRLRLLDPASGQIVWQPAGPGLSLQARLTTLTTEVVEVVRVYSPADPYFTRFGTYLAHDIAIPVRRFGVTVDSTVTLRNGPDATSPVVNVAAPVLPGTTVSALLPVTTAVTPAVAFNPVPAVAPPLPVVAGPIAAGALHRYDIAVGAQPPEDPVTVEVTFRFADPHPAGAGATIDVVAPFAVRPAATLNGPATVAPGATVVLNVVPSDGSPLVPADVAVPAGGGAPAAGITVTVNAAGGLDVVAAATAVPGTVFVVQAQWQGQPARRTMRVA